MSPDERYSRQRDIVPPERLATVKATVIGVGAIGRQVALQLTAMGVPWLELGDFDVVEESNLTSQGYLEDDLARYKVDATADLCQQINHGLEVHVVKDRFRRSMSVGNAVFCCVDKIDARRLIWESVKDRVSFFVDGRMSAESLRVLTAAAYGYFLLYSRKRKIVAECIENNKRNHRPGSRDFNMLLGNGTV